jgi:hypothetical protein
MFVQQPCSKTELLANPFSHANKITESRMVRHCIPRPSLRDHAPLGARAQASAAERRPPMHPTPIIARSRIAGCACPGQRCRAKAPNASHAHHCAIPHRWVRVPRPALQSEGPQCIPRPSLRDHAPLGARAQASAAERRPPLHPTPIIARSRTAGCACPTKSSSDYEWLRVVIRK